MIDLVNLGGQKDRQHPENGGFWNGAQQDLNEMVDLVKFWGDRPDAENGGQNRGAYLLTLKEGVEAMSHTPLTALLPPS